MNKELFTIQILSLIFAPILIPVYIVLNILHKRKIWQYRKLTYLAGGIGSTIVAYIGDVEFGWILVVKKIGTYLLSILDITNKHLSVDITDILFDFWAIGLACLLIAFTYLASEHSSKELLIKREQDREQNRLKFRKFSWNESVNSLTLATTGGGKTVRLTKQVESILEAKSKKERDFICIIDGKGAGETDTYGIFNTMRVLAKRYHHPFVVVNATTNPRLPAQTTGYNPFYGLTSQEVKEMVSVLMFPDIQTNAGAEYYKSLFESWVLSVVELMQQCNEYISLPNITKLLDKDNLLSWMQVHQDEITTTQREEIQKQIQSSWNDIRANIVKLQTFMKGLGKQVFSGTSKNNPFSVRNAYENNYLTLFLISELASPDFSAGIGRVITMDMRILVNNKLNGTITDNRPCRFLLDEFSAYTNKAVLSILSRARSSNSSIHLFTQSISDIEKISTEFLDAVLDNTTVYHIGRQNSPDSAEMIANLIGTTYSTKETEVSSEGIATGFGTNRLVKEFKIHPDQIKELPNNIFIRYDKQHPETLAYVKNEFVDLNL